MITFRPDTCDCILNMDNKTLIKNCKKHTTFTQALTANQDKNK